MCSPLSRDWPPHFTLCEFEISGNTPQPAPIQIVQNLRELAWIMEVVREQWNRPIKILSGYRTPEYNARLHKRSKNVAKKSYHCLGMACDFRVRGVLHREVYETVDRLQRSKIIPLGGLGLYPRWVHIDYRGTIARWGGKRV